jgi:hypothetical protein
LLLLKVVAGAAQLPCCSSQLLTQVSDDTRAPVFASRLWLSASHEQVSSWSLLVPPMWGMLVDCQLQALLVWLCDALENPKNPELPTSVDPGVDVVRLAGKLCLPADLWLARLLLLVGGLEPSSCRRVVQGGTLKRFKVLL